MKGIRIWWQSSLVIDKFPQYAEAIERHAEKVLDPGTEIEVHGVVSGTTELHYHYSAYLNTREIVENVLRAQEEGFDAVAIGCGMDTGLEIAKEILDIPVFGLSETGMHVACMLGKKFAVITHQPLLSCKRIDGLVRRYGLESRYTQAGDFTIDLEVLARSFDDPGPALAQLETAIQECIKRGAEIVIPGCNILNLIAIQNEYYEYAGVPVLDVAGNLMKVTEAMVTLSRVCGLRVSRKGYFNAPSKDLISDIKAIYAQER